MNCCSGWLMEKVVPYKNENTPKKEQVRQMFNNIAYRYDFLNHFLTAGIDKYWRRKVRKIAVSDSTEHILDMASGTGDLAIELAKLSPKSITGVDISEKMLDIAEKKIRKRGLENIIDFKVGDAEDIEAKNNTYDVVTCAFGVRNFQDMNKGLTEFHRVLKNNGRLIVLELSIPNNLLFSFGYNMYFRYVLPLWGRIVSKDLSAYKYLPESVAQFPKPNVFLDMLTKAGFKEKYAKSVSLGIATIFVATK